MITNSFTDYVKANHSEDLADIARHGCSSGFSGLAYYTETVALFDKYRDDIFEILGEMADSMGQTILELVASFNGAEDVGSFEQFANLCVWAAVEEIARQETDKTENNEEVENPEIFVD